MGAQQSVSNHQKHDKPMGSRSRSRKMPNSKANDPRSGSPSPPPPPEIKPLQKVNANPSPRSKGSNKSSNSRKSRHQSQHHPTETPPSHQGQGPPQPNQHPQGGPYNPQSPTQSPPNIVVLKAPGLDYLKHLEYLFIAQQVAPTEIMTNFNVQNCYNIYNIRGEMIYFGKEMSEFLERNYAAASDHGFDMPVYNGAGMPIMFFRKPLIMNYCGSANGEIYIYAPADKLAGMVRHIGTCCVPEYIVFDETGNAIFKIDGPCNPQYSAHFGITSVENGQPIGLITKQWSGYLQEAHTTADNFGVQFPQSLDIRLKAVLLGATILIDYMFFEKQPDNGHRWWHGVKGGGHRSTTKIGYHYHHGTMGGYQYKPGEGYKYQPGTGGGYHWHGAGDRFHGGTRGGGFGGRGGFNHR